MKIDEKQIGTFVRFSSARISDWILDGLTTWARDEFADAFYPHSFINLFDHPVEGLEALYGASTQKTKRAIRSAVLRLGAVCRRDCREHSNLTDEERTTLQFTFLRLAESSLCFEASNIIASMACEDAPLWEDKAFGKELAAACIRCLGNMAINHEKSSFWRPALAGPIEAALLRFVTSSPYFEPRMSPFLLAALVSVSPEKLSDHLTLCGDGITELHRQEPEQRALAHLTALAIVSKAPLSLFRNFSSLDFRYRDSKDRWLVEALFATAGPLQLRWYGNDPTKPLVSPKGRPKQVITLRHDDWIGFQPESTIDLQVPAHDSKALSQLAAGRVSVQNFFHNAAVGRQVVH